MYDQVRRSARTYSINSSLVTSNSLDHHTLRRVARAHHRLNQAELAAGCLDPAGWVGDDYDGVHVFAPDGDRIGLIRLPEICGNVCFGGTKRNRLFMAASQSLYAVYVETRGAHIT